MGTALTPTKSAPPALLRGPPYFWSGPPLSALHQQPDACPFLAVDRDVDEGGDADEVEPTGSHVAARDGDGLDRLVDRSGADRLDLDAPFAANDAGDGACHGDRLRGGRNLEHL